jgi:hypothetical protein
MLRGIIVPYNDANETYWGRSMSSHSPACRGHGAATYSGGAAAQKTTYGMLWGGTNYASIAIGVAAGAYLGQTAANTNYNPLKETNGAYATVTQANYKGVGLTATSGRYMNTGPRGVPQVANILQLGPTIDNAIDVNTKVDPTAMQRGLLLEKIQAAKAEEVAPMLYS